MKEEHEVVFSQKPQKRMKLMNDTEVCSKIIDTLWSQSIYDSKKSIDTSIVGKVIESMSCRF